MINTTRLNFSRIAVSNSWLFIMKPPSPQTAMTRRFGYNIAAIIADGKPGAHRRQRIVQQQRVGDAGAVVSREPDLVHAVVEGDDAVRRHDAADIVHEPLRRQSVLGGTLGDPAQNALAQRQQRLRVRNLAFDPVRQKPQRRADIANHLGLREIDLLDIRRLIADMNDLRPVPPMMKGGFSTVSWPIVMMRSARSMAS